MVDNPLLQVLVAVDSQIDLVQHTLVELVERNTRMSFSSVVHSAATLAVGFVMHFQLYAIVIFFYSSVIIVHDKMSGQIMYCF